MAAAPRERGSSADAAPAQRGVPDGLLIGVLAFLLASACLVWTATGLAGILSHGAWPDGVEFTRTPAALRSLLSAPQDLPAAWPGTPPGQLSGWGLFWGLAIGQLLLVLTLALAVAFSLARRKAVRRDRTAQHDDLPPSTAPAGTPATSEPTLLKPTPTTSAQHSASPSPAAPRPEPSSARTSPYETEPHLSQQGPDVRSFAAAPPSTPVETMFPSPRPEQAAPPFTRSSAYGIGTGLPEPAAQVQLGPRETRLDLATRALQAAEGAALVVTSAPTLWAETKDARSKLGPVHLYDPSHLCDTPDRLHWSPIAGCQDMATATTRSAALLAPVRPHSPLDAAVADTAQTMLRCFLHAAETAGKGIKHLHRWSQGSHLQEAVTVLRTHPRAAPGSAGELESALTAHPVRRDQALQLIGKTLASLSSVHIRNACGANRSDVTAVESFVAEGGTLYVVGESVEDPKSHPDAVPLVTAFASYVVEHGRRVAARSPAGRLDPPALLVLEDLAAVAPLPQLPELLAAGPQEGIHPLVLLRSEEQARSRWPGEPSLFTTP
ncbi:type VI secretion protein [Streptomyces koyangensis]|uniref:Type VI secretion protein n=1 Tax=Streptomyces koyangensis TaxID=188770 RepID=A0ABX7EFF6_9ACTN|nr:type VI secretion protein [Streptomyces koyangensis]QRF03228.1 type VI secretion protein [Streptomyces koyangensis]